MSQGKLASVLYFALAGTILLGAAPFAPSNVQLTMVVTGLLLLLQALLRGRTRTDPPKASRVSDPIQQGQPAQHAVVANGMAYVLFTNNDRHQVHRYDGNSWRPLATAPLETMCENVTVTDDATPAVYAWCRTGVWRAPETPTDPFAPVAFDPGMPSPQIERLGAMGEELFVLVSTNGARCIAWRGNPSSSMSRLTDITPDASAHLEPVLGTNGPFLVVVDRHQKKQQLVLVTAAGRVPLHSANALASVTATPTQVVFAASGTPSAGQTQLWRLTAPFVPAPGTRPSPPSLVADQPRLVCRNDSAVVAVVGNPGGLKFLLVPTTGAPSELPVATDPSIDEVIGVAIERGSIHALVVSQGSLLFLQHCGAILAVRGTEKAMQPAPTEFVVADTTMACCNGTEMLVCRSSGVTRMLMLDQFNQALSAPRHLFAVGGKVHFEAAQGTTRAIYRLTD